MDKGCILIVDDDDDILAFLRRVLTQEGFRVVMHNNPLKALKAARDLDYQLAILDIAMPGLDGLELAVRLRMHKIVPFIFLSAHHEHNITDRAGKIGSATYLVKPVRRQQLLATVRQVFGLPQPIQANKPAIQHRKAIERAKGIYQGKYDLSEANAYQQIKSDAAEAELSIYEFCQRVVDAQEVLADFLARDS